MSNIVLLPISILKKGQNCGFIYCSLHYLEIRQRKMITVNCHRQLKWILCSVTNWLCTNESQHCINTRLLDSSNLHLQLEWLSLQGNYVTGNSVPKCLVIKDFYFSKMLIKLVDVRLEDVAFCEIPFLMAQNH